VRFVGVWRVSAGGDERPGHATRRSVIAGVLVPRGVRAGMDAGRTRAAEGHGRRLILCTRNRTDPTSGCAKNGDAPVAQAFCALWVDLASRKDPADGLSSSIPARRIGLATRAQLRPAWLHVRLGALQEGALGDSPQDRQGPLQSRCAADRALVRQRY